MSSLTIHNSETRFERVGEIVSIFQRSETWYANYQHNGKQCRRSLKTRSKKEAGRRAIQLEADLQAGRYQEPSKACTINQLISAYTKYLETEGKAKKTCQKVAFIGRLISDLAARRNVKSIQDVNLAFVDAHRSERFIAGRKPRTVQNDTVIIRQYINFALQRRMIGVDPLAGLKIQKVKSYGQPCWSPAEVESILATLVGPYHDAFVLWADTGMRFAEVAWLTWADINLDNNSILIRVKKGWKPKTGEERAVPMSTRVHAMLSQRPRQFDWVYTMQRSAQYPAGDHQLQESRLLAYLKRRLKRLSLLGYIHTFRHSFVTNALMAGIPEAVVRQWVGHLDHDVTKIYTHVRNSDSQAAMQRFSDLVALSANGKEATPN